MWGGGCGHENPTLVQNFTYLEPDSIISSLFVQSVIFCISLPVWSAKQIGGCGEVGVGVVVKSCGCGEVGVGRWVWVWSGGCGYGEVGVGMWCGCGELSVGVGS